MICWMHWGPCLPKTGAEQGDDPIKKETLPFLWICVILELSKTQRSAGKEAFLLWFLHWKKSLPRSRPHRLFWRRGVSTESGIPDFRSVDGLYHQKYDYPPETIWAHTLQEGPEEFYRFCRISSL